MGEKPSHRTGSVGDTRRRTPVRRPAACKSMPLVDRLESIFFCDPVAQRAATLLAALAGPPVFAMDSSSKPFSHAMSVEVLGPAFALVMLGLVLVLDFRNWAREKVSREAAALGKGLKVSLSMQLSSHSLQSSYHRWIYTQIPAVKWNPWMAIMWQLVVHVQFARKSDICCNAWLPQSLLSVVTAGMAGYLGARSLWGDRVPHFVQSHLSLAMVTYGGIMVSVMSAAGNLCFLHLFGDWTLGTGETTAFAGMHHGFVYGILYYGVAVVDMVYLHWMTIPALLTTTASVYLQFLYHNGGSISLSSDPGLWGLLMTGLGATLACQLALIVRYCITQASMTSFLRSIPR